MRVVFSLLLLTSCVPAIAVGTGAMLIGMMCREKGISGTLTDADLSAKVRSNFSKTDYENDQNLSSRVGIAVNNSEVLLTGIVDSMEQKMMAEQTVWEVFGVKQVINHIQTKNEFIPNDKIDFMITTKVKTALLQDQKIHIRSFNYAIKTINGVVYIMGIAKDAFERDRALNIASRVYDVKKVVSLVRLRHEVL